jgi:hypothetical protein
MVDESKVKEIRDRIAQDSIHWYRTDVLVLLAALDEARGITEDGECTCSRPDVYEPCFACAIRDRNE